MIKNNKRKIDKIFSSLFIFALYLILIIPVTGILSGINLFINCNFGKQEIIKVNGIIISKFKNESYRDRSCKFDLLVSNKKIILKTSPEIYKKYKLNDTINIYMIKGSKGIIYERY
jgi:hypothetical protein